VHGRHAILRLLPTWNLGEPHVDPVNA
jgi:hypothetical protein